jgi:hypothetical protein
MEYRFYCLDANNKIVSADTIRADSVEEAVAAARESCSGAGFQSDRVEVWQGTRRVHPQR